MSNSSRKPNWMCSPPPSFEGFKQLALQAKGQEEVSQLFEIWKAKAVPELFGVLGLKPEEFDQAKYLQKPRFKKVQAVTNARPFPLVGLEGRTWRHIAGKLGEYRWYAYNGNYYWARRVQIYLCRFKPTHALKFQDAYVVFRRAFKRLGTLDDIDLINSIALANFLASEFEADAAKTRSARWTEWLLNASLQPGQPKLHKFSKGPPPWSIMHCRHDSSFNDIQYDADCRAAEWHSQWLVEQPPLEEWQLDSSLAELSSLGVLESVEDVRGLSKTYKANTAIGSDWLHPRHFALLSDASLEAFLVMARVLLILGRLPELLQLLLVALIPKPTGGDRPIGIFPTCIRIISKLLRRSYGVKWLEKHNRDYMYGAKGCMQSMPKLQANTLQQPCSTCKKLMRMCSTCTCSSRLPSMALICIYSGISFLSVLWIE